MRRLVRKQLRQVFGAGQHAEERELGERTSVHACGGGEDHALQFLGRKVGCLDLRAAASSHGLHPLQLGVSADSAPQRGRLGVGDAVEHLGAVYQFVKTPLLFGGAPESGVSLMVARPPHGRKQIGFDHQLDPRLGRADSLDIIGRQRFGDDDTQLIHLGPPVCS